MNRSANQFVLTLETLHQNLLIKAAGDQIVIRRAFGCEDLPLHINERQDQRRAQTLIFGLHVVNDAVKFNVCVVAGDHSVS